MVEPNEIEIQLKRDRSDLRVQLQELLDWKIETPYPNDHYRVAASYLLSNIQNVWRVFMRVSEGSWPYPPEITRQIREEVGTVRGLVEFFQGTQTDRQARGNEKGQFDRLLGTYHEHLTKWLPILSAQSGIDRRLENLETIFEQTNDKVQRLLVDKAIEDNATRFSDEATASNKLGMLWLLIAVTGVGCVLLIVYGYIPTGTNIPGVSHEVSGLVNRIALLAISSVLIFSGLSHFSKSRHNYTLNRQRHNALLSFQRILDGAGDDPGARHVIVQQIATAVFSPQATGYERSDAEPATPVAQILNLIEKKGQ